MKINKKGEVKLDKCETRIGNYVVREEKEYIKVSDIHGMVSWRFNSVYIGKGLFMKEMMNRIREKEEFAEDALRNIIFTDHYALTAVLDANDMVSVVETVTKCIKRHPELYGLQAEPSEEKNEQDLQAVKDLNALQEELSAIAEKEETKEDSN